jgi:hypothetical protein
MMKFSVRTVSMVFALFALIAPTLHAQVGGATLTATITDPSGAVIPNVQALLTDAGSGTHRASASNGAGIVSFIGLPAATYTLEITANGYRKLRKTDISVHINDQVDLKDIALTVSTADISVTVTTESTQVTPTTSGEQAYTLGSSQIQNLNIESRSAIELLDLIPGAANTGNFTGNYNRQQAGFGQNASTYTVNGNRFDQVQIVSDGAPVTDLNTAGAAAVTPNVDMISEAKVETSAFSAVQPDGPVVFETQTKSGGAAFHGEGYIQARNHIFDATDAYAKSLACLKRRAAFTTRASTSAAPCCCLVQSSIVTATSSISSRQRRSPSSTSIWERKVLLSRLP